MNDPTRHPSPPAERLALRPREAAQLLGVSERHLHNLTKRGDVPCVRFGRAVGYPVESLRRWLAEQAAASAPTREGGAR